MEGWEVSGENTGEETEGKNLSIHAVYDNYSPFIEKTSLGTSLLTSQ